MSSEFSNEFTSILESHGDTVSSLVCGENRRFNPSSYMIQ